MVDKIAEGANAALQQQMGASRKEQQQASSNFEQFLNQTLSETNKANLEAGKMAEGLAAGEHRNIHETMIASQEASLSFRMVSEVRGKVVEAYNKIWRMPV
ncbi:MAG: flagellar hook-basal body complex protein FliE [Thiohalorhabdus sp.]|uniref:flagellar hook-basal body complex protein FliE n=1 Tax=Thiohalorhabdus sp. TaxID=3094134 RepID=UPI002FC30C3A